MSEKELFAEFRRHNQYPGIAAWFATPERIEFERRFGHVLCLPLDLPKVELKDPQKFKEWFFHESKPITKIANDVAGRPSTRPVFQSISTMNNIDPIWTNNNRDDIETLFPEIGEAVARLPLIGKPSYSLWSSMTTVIPHRDQGPWTDGPCSMRIKLYDENPRETLYVEEAVPERLSKASPRLVPTHLDTNTFAWNNLRTKHGSFFNPSYRKVLLIITKQTFDIPKYSELLERSMQKYGKAVQTSKRPISDFVKQVDWIRANSQS